MTDKSFEETKQADVTESWEIGCFGQSNHNRMPTSVELSALPTATEEVVLSFLLERGLASF